MKYTNPKISVIIPVYNTASYLQESVGSIISQTIKEIEIIIIDDGSSDQSPEILRSFAEKDERIIIITQKNAGQSVARNRGIDIAKGGYLYFMDSDDILDSKALEECYNKCDSESLDLVIFNGESFFDDNSQKPIFDYNITDSVEDEIHNGIDLFTALAGKNKFSSSPCLYLVKRMILEHHSLSFYPGIIHEDNLFTALVYIYSEKVGILPHTYFKRRIRGNSTMTSRVTWRNIYGYLATSEEIIRIATDMTEKERSAVDVYLSSTMTAVCYKARKLPFNERIRYIKIMCSKYRQYVPAKDVIKVLFSKK